MKHQHSRLNARKGGFTLVEIIVVLAISALLSSIVFAAFKSIGDGNKKTSCQNNLVQIYQALRLYGQDFNGEFPSYNPHVVDIVDPTKTGGPVANRAPAGLGLWALYAYPISTSVNPQNLDCDGRTTQLPPTEAASTNEAPLASYIKSPRFFHCPYDQFEREVVNTNTECQLLPKTLLKTDVLTYTDPSNVSRFNPFYNSYQTTDEAQTGVRNQAPYSSFRAPNASRQLVYYNTSPDVINAERRTPDTTVVTWCRFHRKLDKAGLTVEKASNSDNVLFMDGTVRYLPTKQPIGSTECAAWQRIPQETIEGYNSANPNTCPQ